MARPKKEGLDYFPHDTDAVSDEKIEALRILYGNDGYAFYFILLERIYKTPKGELVISDAEMIQILAKKIDVSVEKFNQMLETALNRDAFDKNIYDKRQVLTSSGIKKRMGIVIQKRRKMREKYQEVSDAETKQKSGKNSPEMPQKNGNLPLKERKVKESKVKESKVKESKVKESKVNTLTYDQQIQEILKHWDSKKIIVHDNIPFDAERKALEILKAGKKLSDIKQAVDNYASVWFSGKSYLTQRYTLLIFLRHIDEYMPINFKLEEFYKNSNNKQEDEDDEPYPNMRDFTAERLERERLEREAAEK